MDLNIKKTDRIEELLTQAIEDYESFDPGTEEAKRQMEVVKLLMEAQGNKSDNRVKICRSIAECVLKGAEITLPLILFDKWMQLGLEFEKDGAFTSHTFRTLIGRLYPR